MDYTTKNRNDGCVVNESSQSSSAPTEPMRSQRTQVTQVMRHTEPLHRVGIVYLCCTAERKEWIPIGRAQRDPEPNSEVTMTLRATPLTGLLKIVWYDGDPNRSMSLKGILE